MKIDILDKFQGVWFGASWSQWKDLYQLYWALVDQYQAYQLLVKLQLQYSITFQLLSTFAQVDMSSDAECLSPPMLQTSEWTQKNHLTSLVENICWSYNICVHLDTTGFLYSSFCSLLIRIHVHWGASRCLTSAAKLYSPRPNIALQIEGFVLQVSATCGETQT